jgi:hypothetical protein
MIDFIIIGRGLAASVLAHALHNENISFKLIGNSDLSNCSKVAAGIWNPIVFKRMTKSWLANDLVPALNQFYGDCEKKVGKKLITQRVLIKPFTEDQEKKLWLNKASLELSDFLDDTIYNNDLPDLANCIINNQYGIVKQSGNLNMAEFLRTTDLFFAENLIDEIVDHKELIINSDHVSYKGIIAKNIIFCEGHLVKNNSFFNWVPFKPAKGEVLTISAPDLKLKDRIFNKNGFLMDLENGTFKLGATYEWHDLTDDTSEKGLNELKLKLTQLVNCNYTIVSHSAGVRPSSNDRRPVIGKHPAHSNLFIFNGLGTKGVMLAPYFAKKFVNFYLQKEVLSKDVNVDRFYSHYAH